MKYLKRIAACKSVWFTCALVMLLSFGLNVHQALAQKTSRNNHRGSWEVAGSWTAGGAPAYTGIGGQNFNIYGYITLGTPSVTRNMSFAQNQEAYKFTIYDTLVVHGNLTFENKAMDLVLASGGLLIVFGDLTLNNKLDINSSGNIIVTGTFSKQGAANQGSYTGGGNVYAGGFDIPTNWVPAVDRKNTGNDLLNDLPGVYNFINGNGATPLPVKLISFTAESLSGEITIRWATATEENFDHFELQHAADGISFETIGIRAGTPYSYNVRDYSFVHDNPPIGLNYYRLKSIDLDGSFEYSNVIRVNHDASPVIEIYPNPVTNGFAHLKTNLKGDVEVRVLDNLGVIVYSSLLHDTAQIAFPAQLHTGNYIMKVKCGEVQKTLRISVQN